MTSDQLLIQAYTLRSVCLERLSGGINGVQQNPRQLFRVAPDRLLLAVVVGDH